MKQLIGLFAMVLVLSGCASRERYETELQGYVGKPISVVMDSWGYPSGSFEAPNGNLVYVWDKQSQYISPPTIQDNYAAKPSSKWIKQKPFLLGDCRAMTADASG